MKKLILSLSLAAITLAGYSQTNTAATSAADSTLWTDIKQIGSDGYSALKDANFSSGFTVTPFALIHKGDYGGGIAVETASSNLFNVGFALAGIHSTDPSTKKGHFEFYDASLSLQIGQQIALPVVKWPTYMFAETGPAVNLKNPDAVLLQSVAGVKIKVYDKNGLAVWIDGGIGKNSEWPEPFYLGGLSVTKLF